MTKVNQKNVRTLNWNRLDEACVNPCIAKPVPAIIRMEMSAFAHSGRQFAKPNCQSALSHIALKLWLVATCGQVDPGPPVGIERRHATVWKKACGLINERKVNGRPSDD